MLGLELAGYDKMLRRCLVLLLHRAVNMVHCLINSPLDPNRRSIRSAHRPTLLETRSRQGSVVNSVRTWGREPLRSASHLLGFTISLYFGDPGRRLAAGPICGPLCLQDSLSCSTPPGSFGGWHLVGMGPHRDAIVQRLLAAAFSECHGGGGECLRHI